MRFRVVALHPTTVCNYNCWFCYKKKMQDKEIEPSEKWFKLPKYLSKITNQVAVGGGEIFLFPDWIERFGKECKKHSLIFNITTNGKCDYENMGDEVFENIKMISISWDRAKIKSVKDAERVFELVKFFHSKGVLVGVNLLVDEKLFEKKFRFLKLVSLLFKKGFDRVYALYPKLFKGPDLTKVSIAAEYFLATKMYKHFYVDDLTLMILKFGFDNWKEPCHYGKDICSINENFEVSGCSFEKECALKIEKPEDVLKLEKIKFEKRHVCPYLVR